MVVEQLLGLLAGFSGMLVGLFPDWDVPAWVSGVDEQANHILGYVEGFGGYVDFTFLLACGVAALGTWIVCLVIKAARAVASYVPLFGGAG